MRSKDAEALDLMAQWFQKNTGENEVWNDTAPFVTLAAGLLVDSGRSIVRPADAPKPCACGEPASYQGFCDQCIIRIGKEIIDKRTTQTKDTATLLVEIDRAMQGSRERGIV